jgi:hypothetical protein
MKIVRAESFSKEKTFLRTELKGIQKKEFPIDIDARWAKEIKSQFLSVSAS